MNLDQIATKCFILALFIRDDGQRLLLGDGYYDFNQKLQHFQANTIANDVVEIQGDNGQLLAGQVMRSGAQKFEGYIGDATTHRQTIEQKRSDFMAFFRIKHFYKVIYIFPDGTAIQRQRGYLTDAPTIPEIFQKFPEYSVALNFEDANYYEYAEDDHGDEIYAHIAELALAGEAIGGLIWDAIGAVTNGITWSGIQTAQGEYIQITNELDIPAKLASVEMLGKAEQTTLPSDYQAVEYIEANATQYIDTGVQLGANDFTIETGITPTADASYEQPFLSIWTSTYGYWNWFKSGQNLDCYTSGHHYINSGATTGTYYDLKLSRVGNTWSQSSNSASDSWTFSPSSVNNTTLKLFNRGDLNGKTNAQLYYLRIFVAGELVRNYVPCYRISDSVIGLYDLVKGTFSVSAGTDNFTKGTDTSSPSPSCPQDINVVTGENVVKIEGKNLFHFTESRSATITGMTFSIQEGASSFTMDGSNTSGANNYFDFVRRVKPLTLRAGTYTMKIEGLTNWGSGRDYIYIGDANTGSVIKYFGTPNWTNTFTLTEDTPVSLAIIFDGNATYSNKTITLMLAEGTTAEPYEPYQEQEFEVNLGKNLFELTASTRTDAGVEFTKTTDTITASGTTTRPVNAEACSIYDNFSGLGNYPAYATISATNSFQLPAGTYTLSASITNNGNTTGGLNIGVGELGARVSTSTKLEKTAGTSGQASATVSVTEGQYVLLTIWYEGTSTNKDVNISATNIQLEKGSQATSFAPYFTPIELAKIGNYQDRIYKEDSKWYIEKQVGKVVLDGTESGWTWADTARYAIATSNIGARVGMSDNFTYVNYTGHATTASPSFDISSNLASIGFHDKDITSLNNFKTWLASNPTTVYYALATPTTTEITNEALIAQLEALGASSLYLGINNIGTETLNAMPTLKIEYYTEYTLDGAGYEWEPGGNTAKTIVTVAGVDSAWPIWTVQGGAQNPTLTNITTGQTISWQGFVPEGQTLTINMAEMTADLAGANVFEYITGEWLRLAPGNNTLVYNAGNADKPSTLSWNGVLA